MPAIDTLAILSGCFHAGGYIYYLVLSRRGIIEPNPASWLMFAYGTGLLVVIEADVGAGWHELLLPVICALSSVLIALIAWRNQKSVLSLTVFDLWTFWADLALTAAYFTVWMMARAGYVSADERAVATLVFLACSIATTLTSFMPLLKSTARDPATERAGPWLVWSSAYFLLLLTTALHQSPGTSIGLMLYPAVNLLLHATMAYLSFPKAGARHV
jgi:hypothetical protein